MQFIMILFNKMYIGSAFSHFQSEPVPGGQSGKFQPVSDWELEVKKNLSGKPSAISRKQTIDEFPHFLPKRKLYVGRSAALGENMLRFSLDFARLCPEAGEFDEELMREYMKTLALIRAQGQEPMLTLYHWPMPLFLLRAGPRGVIQRGGWESDRALEAFEFYARKVAASLGDPKKIRDALNAAGVHKKRGEEILAEGLVKYFISINEPINLLLPTYISGTFPPFKKWRFDLVPSVLRRLIAAHDTAFRELKRGLGGKGRMPQIGVAHHLVYFDGPFGPVFRYMNEWVLKSFERGGEHTDFLGVQYYVRKTIPLFNDSARNPGPYFGDVYPEGMYAVLKEVHAMYPRKEIFITEFGFAESTDRQRPYWIMETIKYVLKARKEGFPIKGILLWSLVDSFEWALGMQEKFGLFSEEELETPMVPAREGIKSWEVWRAIVAAVRWPTPRSTDTLRKSYEKAVTQYFRGSSAPTWTRFV